MQTYLIERSVPGLGAATTEELAAMSQKSNGVVADLGPGLQWVQSYVTDDKLFCYYYADDEDLIREHARRGGFPCNRISVVSRVINPTTATD